MGAYLRKPITDKTSECGEYTMGGRKLVYAATAMQGWRVAMEDAHSIVPDFDKDTSLFAVYDGHGGKEVAMYCAEKLGDIIKSTDSYNKGDMSRALKDAFMKCDEIVMKAEAIQEMKKMINTETSAESGQAVAAEEEEEEEEEDPQEELNALIEEANVPLHSLLAKYRSTNVSEDTEGDSTEAPDVKSVLQMMASRAGIEIEFEDTESDLDHDSESESENEDADQLEGDCNVINDSETVIKSPESSATCSKQPQDLDRQNADLQHSEQTHSVKADKFSLASLLTSSSSDISYTHSSLSTASKVTATALSDPHQSLNCQPESVSPPPLHKTLLPNYTKAHSPIFNGQSVTAAHLEKGLHLDCKNDCEMSVKTITESTLSEGTSNESRTSSVATADDTSLRTSDGQDYSTSHKTLSDIAVNKLDAAQITCSSVQATANTLPANDSTVSSTRTKAGGLMDLLTTAVEDKDSTLLMDSSEDKWMSPQSLKEVPYLSRSRKRPHPDDDMDDLTLSEYSAKRHEIMDEEGYHSGTTAVVCILKGDELTVANAGDSRCIVSSKGKALEMSFDHKPSDPPELERITKAGGQVGIDGRVNGGLNLTRAIGDHFYKGNTSLPLAEQMITAMPDIETLRITEDEDFIFLACDGIWNSKSSQEVADFINFRIAEKSSDGPPTADDLVSICKSLCDACLAPDTDNDGTGCDNMTCLLVLLST